MCPQLEAVGVHIGISDYFEDTNSTHSRQHYKEIVSKLNVSFRMYSFVLMKVPISYESRLPLRRKFPYYFNGI